MDPLDIIYDPQPGSGSTYVGIDDCYQQKDDMGLQAEDNAYGRSVSTRSSRRHSRTSGRLGMSQPADLPIATSGRSAAIEGPSASSAENDAGPSRPMDITTARVRLLEVLRNATNASLARRGISQPPSVEVDGNLPSFPMRRRLNRRAIVAPAGADAVEAQPPIEGTRKRTRDLVVVSDHEDLESPISIRKKVTLPPRRAPPADAPVRKVKPINRGRFFASCPSPPPPSTNPLELFSGPLQEILAMAKAKADEAAQEEIAELKRDLRMAEQGRADDGNRHTLELITANTAHADEKAKLEEEVKKLRKENAALLLADAEERIKREALKELEEENKVLAEKNVRLRARVADMSEACQCGAKV